MQSDYCSFAAYSDIFPRPVCTEIIYNIVERIKWKRKVRKFLNEHKKAVSWMNSVVLFDGDCRFCHAGVQFIIKRDSQEMFYFASQQSDAGQRLLKEYRVPADIDSIVLIENGKVYIKSTAALRICRHLRGGWKSLYVFRFMPIVIRDSVYNWIARNRYKWFGKEDSCSIPSDRVRKRFL